LTDRHGLGDDELRAQLFDELVEHRLVLRGDHHVEEHALPGGQRLDRVVDRRAARGRLVAAALVRLGDQVDGGRAGQRCPGVAVVHGEGRGLGCGPPREELGPRVLHRRDRRDGLVHRLAQPAHGEVVDVPSLAVAADLDPEVVRVRGTPERHPVTSWTSPWTGQGSSGSPVPSSAAVTSARSSAGGWSSFASSASTRLMPWARISRSRVRSAWAPASLTESGKTLTWSAICSHTESPDRTRLRADGRTAWRLTTTTLVGCTSGSSRCSGFVLMGMLLWSGDPASAWSGWSGVACCVRSTRPGAGKGHAAAEGNGRPPAGRSVRRGRLVGQSERDDTGELALALAAGGVGGGEAPFACGAGGVDGLRTLGAAHRFDAVLGAQVDDRPADDGAEHGGEHGLEHPHPRRPLVSVRR